ncbi:hypothetical protein QFC22_003846 [Naganishia vaughanmartiniae]|uniref:Uncharacterized protein n=1 Tax=Naganishia vaughanmartiniae TaxID=1424756 RepID=A0ACC2X4Q5_9TREE|nr:hypothetical protein QFC22_003846 [Naganishia vaughanmartiniae]
MYPSFGLSSYQRELSYPLSVVLDFTSPDSYIGSSAGRHISKRKPRPLGQFLTLRSAAPAINLASDPSQLTLDRHIASRDMQPCGVQPHLSAEEHDASTSLLPDEDTGSSTQTMSESTSESFPRSSSSGDHANVYASPSAEPFTKSRARTMSSTMSFSAMFSQPPAATHSRNTSSEYSFFSGNRSRSDTSDSAYSSLGSPLSDSPRFGLLVGSPISVSSDEQYMLGTPSTLVHSFTSPTKSTTTVPTPADTEVFQLPAASPNGKGKGKEVRVEPEESSAFIVADDSNLALWPSGQRSGVTESSTVVEPASDHSSRMRNARPFPLVHSNTYSGPGMSPAAQPGERAPFYDYSGRSTPTANSTTSSMQSRISSMRIKLRRKGSSLIDVMSFKNQDTSRSAIGTPDGSVREGPRFRSGSSAAASTFEVDGKIPQRISAQDRYKSSKKNLRTKIANKFDFSTNRSGALQLTKKQTQNVTPPSPETDSISGGPGLVGSSHAINSGMPNRSLHGIANDRHLPTPLPAMPKAVVDQTPICLGRVVSESPIAIPLSPLSPPLLDTKHHSRIDALGGSIPDFELLDSPPKSTPAFLIVRGASIPQRVSYFDTKLPPELKLRIFETILDLHKAEHDKAISDVGEASSKKERADAALYLSKRWIGDMAGKRELFCISRLQHLDLSRCWRVSLLDEGIFDEDNSWPALKTLKLCGGVAETGILEWLLRAAPNLETLDISHSTDVDDDDVKDLVSAPTDRYQEALTSGRNTIQRALTRQDDITDQESRIVLLTPSQANQLGSDFPCNGMVPRRVTKLRHVNLSHCPNITQHAASYLAYAVPHLEILEMANVGEMSSDGIVALLGTTPHIKKIDLEGATQACDRVMAALTFAHRKHSVIDQPTPGKELETLSLGHATNITTEGALKLLRACPNLAQLNLEVSEKDVGFRAAHLTLLKPP